MDVDLEKLFLGSVLFSELSLEEAQQLIKYAHEKKIATGKVLFHQGDEGHQLYAILNGKVRISATSEMGKEITFNILQTGDVFGEIAIFSEGYRIATATAMENSNLLVIEKKDLIPFLKKKPEVSIKIVKSLCKRLTETSAAMENILFYTLPTRLAKKLLALVEVYGEEHKTGTTINLRLSQSALGNMVSATRESINKQMKLWESENLLTCSKGIITILAMDSIEEIAYQEE